MTDPFEKPVVSDNGRRFANPKSFISWTGLPSWQSLFRWKFREQNYSKIPSKEILTETLPVQKPEFQQNSKLSATWLGHATVFVRMDGISFITDPVWAGVASPCRIAGPSRYRPPPCSIDDLPELRFGVISHNHYDHLDAQAIRKFSHIFPLMEWFVPKGLRDWMLRNSPGSTVHEMSWGEHITLKFEEGNYTVWCIPAQHWSQRTIFDRNKSLWCGWAVVGPEHKFYYTGDTGFCEEEFRKLGDQIGPFDLSAIPIGCYSPRWFMKPQHIDPAEAVAIHKLTKSIKSIGIHWGTYSMGSNEQYLEPRSKLVEAVEAAGLRANEFTTLNHGETWNMENENAEEFEKAIE
jgi:N-acyl-phosphatidylethanolamine-hydrolysing phospholipase D